MTSNVTKLTSLLLPAVAMVGCGGGQDAQGNANPAEDAAPSYSIPSPAVRTEESVDESKGAMGETPGPASDERATTARETSVMTQELAEDAAQATDEASVERPQTPPGDSNAMTTENRESTPGADAGDPCTVPVAVGDSIAYSVDNVSVPSSCESVTIDLDHTGSLPKEAMGHNWVLVPADAIDAIGQAAMEAGLENGYLPDDERIVAATELVGGGESTSVTFSLDKLEDGVDYAYVCTFPGHWTAMQGAFAVE